MAKRKIRECKELTETIEINASNKLAKLSSSSLSKQRRNDVTFSITPLPNTHNMIAVENNTNALTVCPFCGTNLQDLDIKGREVHLNVCLDCAEYQEKNNADKKTVPVLSSPKSKSKSTTIVYSEKTRERSVRRHCLTSSRFSATSSSSQLRITDFFVTFKNNICSQESSAKTTSEQFEMPLTSTSLPSTTSSATTTTATTTTTNNTTNNTNTTNNNSPASPVGSHSCFLTSRVLKTVSNCSLSFPSHRQSKSTLTRRRSNTDIESVDNNAPINLSTPSRRRRCPEYKRVPNTPFIVDDFAHVYDDPVEPVFFLSHFHADHYRGLNRHFNRGPIYCSQITANLIIHRLHVDPQYVHPLPLRVPTSIPFKTEFHSNFEHDHSKNRENSSIVTVTLFDANHCPGSVIFVFEFPDETIHVHTGDFRFDKTLADHQYIGQLNITRLYLDTTYYLPTYSFPPQKEIIDKALQIMADSLKIAKTLIVIGTYTVGKERLFLSAAQQLNCKIYVTTAKMQIIKCLELPQVILERFTHSPHEAQIHVVPMFSLSLSRLEDYLQKVAQYYERLVAFRPTGWTFTKQTEMFNPLKNEKDTIQIYDVPYSEHSSFTELRECVALWKPTWIIPTVNVTANDTIQKLLRS